MTIAKELTAARMREKYRRDPLRPRGLICHCGEPARGRGLCRKHYNEWYYNNRHCAGPLKIVETPRGWRVVTARGFSCGGPYPTQYRALKRRADLLGRPLKRSPQISRGRVDRYDPR